MPLPVQRGEVNAGSLSGERRQVTALFYDIVGSTELLGTLDPEDFGTIQRALHNQAAAAIRSYGGRLDRIQGDGGCAYFGLPVSFEDAAECAVAAALEMVERCIGLDLKIGATLKLRVGIATGFVVVADMTNTALPGQDEVIGITPALAARIQSEAEPNSVAVADATYQLTRALFEFEPIGVRVLRGFPEPVRLWKPLARRPQGDRFTSYRRVTSPLIGRSDELELCHRRWERVQEGHGQLVFLHGEAGIGKSRLVAELRHDLAREAEIVVFQCQPRGDTRPLHPFLDNLKQAVAAADEAGSATDAGAVRRYFQARGADVGDLNSEIIAFLWGSGAEGSAAESWSVDLSAEEVRGRAVEAMLGLLASWSGARPALLVIEDLHWADTLTDAVVARLAETIEALPILVVVTSRDEIAADLLGDPNVLSIALSRLGAAAIAKILDAIWETTPPPRLGEFVYEKSDGVPLFAEELALLLKERFDAGESSLKDWNKALPEGRVLTLQDLIAARLSSLGQLRRVAQVASAIGREFGVDLLSQILDPEALPFSLDAALRELIREGIVRRSAGRGRPTYRFRHVLIQEAAHDSLLRAGRRELHERIVSLIDSGAVTAPADEVVAWHCEQAGRPLRAAQYAIRAAEACVARSAMHEADRLLTFAQEEHDRAGAEAEGANDVLLQLLTTRGPVAAALYGRGAEQARAIYERGVALSLGRDNEDRAKWFPLYWGWWFTAPDYETLQARSEILVRDLEGSADAEVRLQSLHCAWATNFDAGRHAYCLACVEQGLALYDEERARRSRGLYGGHDARVCALGERALSLWFMGDDAGSAESIDAAIRWAEHIDHHDSLFHALDYAVGLKRYRNDPAGVIALADRMAEMAEERASPSGRAKAMLFRGWARALTGTVAAGLAEFEAGLALQSQIGTGENVSIYGDMRAEILGLAGRADEAIQVLDDTIAASTRGGQVFWLPELHRRRALLRRHTGRNEWEIGSDLQRALALAESQHAAALAARARAEIARLDPSQRSPEP